MRLFPAALLALIACGCASAPRPGPTPAGLAVPVPARDKAAARRQAIESLLPLFLTPAARREKAAAVDKAVFADAKAAKAFIGRQTPPKTGDGVVEVRVDALSAALQRAGLIRPSGYVSGPDVVLLALGDRSVGRSQVERFAADALETALFGRGIQAQDADDEVVRLNHPLTAKTESETVKQAAAGGWSELVTGTLAGRARHEVQSDSWRGHAKYSLALYAVDGSSTPALFDAEGEALDVSSASAISAAIEAAAQDAARRAEGLLARKRAGRATISVVVTGWADVPTLRRVLGDLRGTEGVDGAALISWRGYDDMPVIHAYATTLTAEGLAAKLINADPKLRVTAVESEDARIAVEGSEIPASEDMGQP
ncbi:MAG: hypothetical protein ACHQ49_14210 [Elusimicrobiota bacterium]